MRLSARSAPAQKEPIVVERIISARMLRQAIQCSPLLLDNMEYEPLVVLDGF